MDKIEELYQQLKEASYFNMEGADYNTFAEAMKDPGNLKQLYGYLSEQPEHDMQGMDYDAFSSSLYGSEGGDVEQKKSEVGSGSLQASGAVPDVTRTVPEDFMEEGVRVPEIDLNLGKSGKERNILKTVYQTGKSMAKSIPATFTSGTLTSVGITDPTMGLLKSVGITPPTDILQRMVSSWANEQLKASGKDLENITTSLQDIKDPIDALNFMSYAITQAAVQIPMAVATYGTSALGQEVGSIYLDQVNRIAENEGITPEEVIIQGKDEPAIAVGFGIAAAALERVGAGKVMGGLTKSVVGKSLRDKALAKIKKVGGSAVVEGATETAQTAIEEIGASVAAGDDIELNVQELTDAFAAGAVGGGGLTTVGETIGAIKEYRENVKKTNEAVKKVEELGVDADPSDMLVFARSGKDEVLTEQIESLEGRYEEDQIALIAKNQYERNELEKQLEQSKIPAEQQIIKSKIKEVDAKITEVLVPSEETKKEGSEETEGRIQEEEGSVVEEQQGVGLSLTEGQVVQNREQVADALKQAGANEEVATAQSLLADRMMDVVAKRSGITKEEAYAENLKDIRFATENDFDQLEESGAQFQFAGEKAIRSNEQLNAKLKAAKGLEKLGKSPKEIFKDTGMEKTNEGWTYEIDDSRAKLKRGYESATTLEDAFYFPELFELYPDLKELKFDYKQIKSPKGLVYEGFFEPSRNRIVINKEISKDKQFSTLLHELQHAIDYKEDKNYGSNILLFENIITDLVEKDQLPNLEQLVPALESIWDKMGDKSYKERAKLPTYKAVLEDLKAYKKAFNKEADKSVITPATIKKAAKNLYRRTAGEVRARNVQKRNKGGSRIRVLLPSETADVLEKNQILFQGQDGKRGAMDTINAVLYLGRNADVSTFPHELAHLFEKHLTDQERQTIIDWSGRGQDWTMEVSEDFAEGFERYLQEGNAPTPELQTIFDKFKQWLKEVYNYLRGKPLTDEVRQVFANMLGEDIVNQNSNNEQSSEMLEGVRTDAREESGNEGVVPTEREEQERRQEEVLLSDEGRVESESVQDILEGSTSAYQIAETWANYVPEAGEETNVQKLKEAKISGQAVKDYYGNDDNFKDLQRLKIIDDDLSTKDFSEYAEELGMTESELDDAVNQLIQEGAQSGKRSVRSQLRGRFEELTGEQLTKRKWEEMKAQKPTFDRVEKRKSQASTITGDESIKKKVVARTKSLLKRYMKDPATPKETKELLKSGDLEYVSLPMKLVSEAAELQIEEYFETGFNSTEEALDNLLEYLDELGTSRKEQRENPLLIPMLSSMYAKIAFAYGELGLFEKQLSVQKRLDSDARDFGRAIVMMREDALPEAPVSRATANIFRQQQKRLAGRGTKGQTFKEMIDQLLLEIKDLNNKLRAVAVDKDTVQKQVKKKSKRAGTATKRRDLARAKIKSLKNQNIKFQKDEGVSGLNKVLLSEVEELILTFYEDGIANKTKIGREIENILGEDLGIGRNRANEYFEVAFNGKKLATVNESIRNAMDKAGRERFVERIRRFEEETGIKPPRKWKSEADKLIDAVFEADISDQDFIGKMGYFFGYPELTTMQVRSMKDMLKNANKYPKGALRTRRIKAMLDYAKNIEGEEFVDLNMALWHASVLSGTSTQVSVLLGGLANTFGNLFYVMTEGGGYGFKNGLRQLSFGLGEAARILKTGNRFKEMEKIIRSSTLERVANRDLGQGFRKDATTVVSKVAKYTGRIMDALDAVFYYLNTDVFLGKEAYQVAVSEGLKGKAARTRADEILASSKDQRRKKYEVARQELVSMGMPFDDIDVVYKAREMYESAVDQYKEGALEASKERGKEAALQQSPNGGLGALLSLFAKDDNTNAPPIDRNAIEKGLVNSMEMVKATMFPYMKTAANAANLALDYIPVAGISVRALEHISLKGNDKLQPRNFKNQEEATVFVAKQVFGMATMMGLLALMFDDEEDDFFEITANGPSNYQDRMQWYEAGGKPSSIKLGDRRIVFRDWPVGGLLHLVGDLADKVRYEPDKFEDWRDYFKGGEFASATITYFANASMLKTLGDVLKAITEGDFSALTKIPLAPITGFTNPGIFRTFEKVAETSLKDRNTLKDNFLGRITGNFVSQIPIAKGLLLEDKIDAIGEKVVIGENDNAFLKGLGFDRYFPSAKASHPIFEEMGRRGIFFSGISANTKIAGEKMTYREFQKYALAVGRVRKVLVENNLPSLKKQTDKQFEAALKKIDKVAKANAKAIIMNHEDDLKKLTAEYIDSLIQ